MTPFHASQLVGYSAALHAALELARSLARHVHPVLLVGPTGVGKSTLARFLHAWSGRTGEFVAIAGGELVDSLFHNQLFGHEKGAYTGAGDRAPGAFERASGGTLFLDELQHWSRDKQAAVLAAVEERRVTRVGGARALPITCRLVFASTVPLDQLVREDRLLPDLRYRIGEMVVELPRLADRRVDVAALAYYFLEREREGVTEPGPTTFDNDAFARLLFYGWPGNARELERVVQYAAVRAAGQERIRAEHLPERFQDKASSWAGLSAAERADLVTWALGQANGSHLAASRLLGVHRNTILNYQCQPAAPLSAQAPPVSASRRPRSIVQSAKRRTGNKKRSDTIPTLAPPPSSDVVQRRTASL